MRNVVGGFCVGFGLCWGVAVAAGTVAILMKLCAPLVGLLR